MRLRWPSGTSGARTETPQAGQPRPRQDDKALSVNQHPRQRQVTGQHRATGGRQRPTADSAWLAEAPVARAGSVRSAGSGRPGGQLAGWSSRAVWPGVMRPDS
jgi:hypothetical protein